MTLIIPIKSLSEIALTAAEIFGVIIVIIIEHSELTVAVIVTQIGSGTNIRSFLRIGGIVVGNDQRVQTIVIIITMVLAIPS